MKPLDSCIVSVANQTYLPRRDARPGPVFLWPKESSMFQLFEFTIKCLCKLWGSFLSWRKCKWHILFFFELGNANAVRFLTPLDQTVCVNVPRKLNLLYALRLNQETINICIARYLSPKRYLWMGLLKSFGNVATSSHRRRPSRDWELLFLFVVVLWQPKSWKMWRNWYLCG